MALLVIIIHNISFIFYLRIIGLLDLIHAHALPTTRFNEREA